MLVGLLNNKIAIYAVLAVSIIGGLAIAYNWNANRIRDAVINEVEVDAGKSLVGHVKKDKENEERINGFDADELRDSASQWVR